MGSGGMVRCEYFERKESIYMFNSNTSHFKIARETLATRDFAGYRYQP